MQACHHAMKKKIVFFCKLNVSAISYCILIISLSCLEIILISRMFEVRPRNPTVSTLILDRTPIQDMSSITANYWTDFRRNCCQLKIKNRQILNLFYFDSSCVFCIFMKWNKNTIAFHIVSINIRYRKLGFYFLISVNILSIITDIS